MDEELLQYYINDDGMYSADNGNEFENNIFDDTDEVVEDIPTDLEDKINNTTLTPDGYTPDASSNVGTPGSSIPQVDPPAELISVPEPQYKTETITEVITITEYDPEYLLELQDNGFKFYANYTDGTKEEVLYSDVHDPIEANASTIVFTADAIGAASNQHFWNDLNGVHVSDNPKEDWEQNDLYLYDAVEDPVADDLDAYYELSGSVYIKTSDRTINSNKTYYTQRHTLSNLDDTNYHNILMNSLGILLRKAYINFAMFSRANVAFFDGAGNNEENILAFFGALSAQIGRSNSNHVVITSNGVTAYKGDGTLDELTAIVDGVNLKNSTITGSKIASSTIENSNIKDGTIAGSKIASSTIENSNIKDGTITGAKIQGSTLTNIPYAEIDQLKTRNVTADAIQAATGFIASLAANSITAAKLVADQGIIDNLETNFAHIQNGVIDNANINVANVNGLSANYAHITNGTIDNAKIGHADVNGLSANYAHIDNGVIDNAKIGHADVNGLSANYATIANLNAESGRIDDLEADHVSVSDLEAETARINTLVANTADLATIRANAAKVTNLTAAELEADHATVGSLDTNYAQINMANVNNAWIQNGTIKDAAISDGMINSVSANKLTAGTIDASNITVTNLNADNITTGTINGQRIGAGSLSLDKLSEDVYTETEVDSIVSNLQTQIDGAIETWTGTTIPTLQNAPASSWTTNSVKDTHVGDVYFIVNSQSNQNGYNYRFTKSGTGNNVTYSWQLIKDSDVTNALARLTTAEGKITTFDSDISQLKTDTGSITTRTTSLETRMGNAENDILDKVDSTTFNEVSDTVDSHSQSITQMTTTLSNKADSSTVSSLTTHVSKNEQDISGINSTIGSLETTVESKADGSTVETISSKVNTISDTVDGHTQNISSIVSTQTQINYELDKTIVETIRLYTIRSSNDIPSLPTTPILSGTGSSDSYLDNTGNALLDSSNNPIGSDVWSITKPSYNSSKPNYFYCYQHKHVDGSYTWSNVVRDNATTESQNLGHVTNENLTTVTTRVNNISDTVDGHTSQLSTTTTSLTTLRTEFDNLEIGGRNLLKGRSAINSQTIYGLTVDYDPVTHWMHIYGTNTKTDDSYSVAMFSEAVTQELVVGEKYTLTIYSDDYDTVKEHVYFQCNYYRESGNQTYLVRIGNTIYPSYTLSCPSDYTYHDGLLLTFVGIYPTARTIDVTFRLKLEKGNKSTDWTPAPEDLEDYADNAANAVPRMSKINTAQRTFTTDQWKTYGAYGHAESWTTGSSYDNSHLRIGDRAYLTGTISDQMHGSATIIGKVTSVVPDGSGTSSVQMQSEQLIFGGDAVSAIQTSLSETQTDYATFKQTTQQFESTIGSTYATKEELTTTVEQATQQYVDVEAEPFIIDDDGINAPLRSIEANGWSEQLSTTGKNLLPREVISSSVVSGVTFKENQDGSFTANGTATANIGFAIGYTSPSDSLSEGTYTLSGCPAGGSQSTYSLRYFNNNTNISTYDYGNGGIRTLTSDQASQWNSCWVYIMSGVTCNNLTFYPQLELGSIATAYEPYTGGAPSPSPDYPQEIKVARGRNLVSPESRRDGYYVDYATNAIKLAAGSTSYVVKVNRNTDYVLTFDGGNRTRIAGIDTDTISNGTPCEIYHQVDTNNTPRVFNSGNHDYVVFTTNNSQAQATNIQLTLGSTPQPYVSYGYVGLEVQGKNLFGGIELAQKIKSLASNSVIDESAKTVTFIASEVSGDIWFDGFEAGKTYTVFLNKVSGYGNYVYYKRDGSVGYFNQSTTLTDGSLLSYLTTDDIGSIGGTWASSSTTFNYDKCGIFEGDVSWDDFEPYYHTTTPIPLPERGWVGALRDDTADALAIDWVGEVTWEKETDKTNLSDVVLYGKYGNDSANLFYKDFGNNFYQYTKGYNRLLCDNYVAYSSDVAYMPDKHTRYQYNIDSDRIYFRDDRFDTAEQYNIWLANNPVTVMYPLPTPIVERCGYITMPEVYPGCTVSIPELDEVGISYWTPASKSLVDNTRLLEERVSNAETSIDQNKDQIALRAKSSDVYTKTQTDGLISTEVSNRNAAIQLSADGINTEVSKKADKATIISTIRQSAETVKIKASQVEIDGAAIFSNSDFRTAADAAYDTKGSAAAVQTNLDNLEIGGRNLLKNTDVHLTTISTGSIYIPGGTAISTIPIGSTITVSIDIDTTDLVWISNANANRRIGCEASLAKPDNSGYQYVGVWAGSAISSGANVVEVISGSVHKRISKTFTLLANWPANTIIYIYCQGVSSGTISVGRVKVEYGNKPTDWSPAPEDVDSAIGTAKTEAINASYANYGYKYHKDIVVYGDSDKYYPVYFNNNQSDYTQDVPHNLLIKRGYSEQAPSDWYSSTHKGSLTLRVRWNYGGWGGATYNCQVYEWSEQYSTIVGDILVGNKSGMNSTIYLRGGGTTGALYHLYSDVAFDTTVYGTTFPYIGTTTPGTVYMQTSDGNYKWYVDNPLTTPNKTHILSLASVSEEQYIYISKASGTNLVASTDTWVTANSDSQNTWTTKRPTYNDSYPVLFVAKQKRTTTGHIICTTPVKDDTTTIIDGGHITTGAIDASRVTVTNLDASKITTGSLSADRIKANVISAVNNGTGTINADKINVSALSIGFSQLTDTPAFATADQLSTVIDGQNSVNDRVDESIVNTKILYTTRDVSTLPDAPNTPIISDSNISGAYLDSSSNLLLDSSGNAIMSKTWTVSRPSYSQEEPYYFYCYQYEHADGSYTWSNVMRDDATNESFKVLSSRVEIVCSSINYDNSTASLLAKLYVNNAETSGNHYQWFRDGAILTNQTNQTLTVTASMGINHLYSCTVDY